jgi:hypothetical protein
MKKLLLLTASVLFIVTSGCYKEKAAPSDCEIVTVSYSEDIVPIIDASCKAPAGKTGCHESWIGKYPNVKNRIKEGSWQNVVFDLKSMPKIPNLFSIDSLNEDELFIMKCWIEQGYKND